MSLVDRSFVVKAEHELAQTWWVEEKAALLDELETLKLRCIEGWNSGVIELPNKSFISARTEKEFSKFAPLVNGGQLTVFRKNVSIAAELVSDDKIPGNELPSFTADCGAKCCKEKERVQASEKERLSKIRETPSWWAKKQSLSLVCMRK